ncbi:MAG: glycosyltransferase family 4 protein [Vicinamibacteria bacterium]
MSPSVTLVAASLEILGGQGVQAATLLEQLRADGQRARFLPIDPELPRAARPLRRVRVLRTLVNQALYLPSLRRLAQSDVAHVFCAAYWSFLLAAVPAILAARALGKRVILNYHSGEAPDHLARWGALVHPWLRRVDAIAVPSEFLGEVFARHGYRAHVIPNVVDLGHFRFRDRDAGRLRLLSVRNFEAHYRVGNSIEALAVLLRRRPHATLTVAGYGSEEAALRRTAARLRGAVRFVGRVPPSAIAELYDAHDVFLNSSVIDNQPLSILEAFACGLPVVTTATGGIASMVRDGETGLLVPPDDPVALAAAVERLAQAPGEARELARRARLAVARHTWPEVRERWLKLYAGATP